MVRRVFPATALVALVAVGCVPVTEPVGDVTKAEIDTALVGLWKNEDGRDVLKIDVPVVKGNPKGLMRWTGLADKKANEKEEPIWFFVSTVGKEKYGNMCMSSATQPEKDALDFSKEGQYAKWAASKTRAYLVFHYTPGKDDLKLNFGDEKAFKKIAADAKLTTLNKTEVYETPAGWLEKYLDKNGRDKLYPADAALPLKRSK